MVKVGANISELQSKMGSATNIVTKTAKSIVDVGDSIKRMGAKATVGITVPVVGGMLAAANAAGNFEKQMNVLQASMGANSQQMKQFGSLAQQLGRDTKLPGISAADAAASMTLLGKAGLSVSDVMKGVRGTLLLSTAAQIDQATAADLTASALNAFQLKGSKATMVADLLAGSAQSAQGEITDMGFALQMAATVGHQSGQSIQDTVTAITQLAKAGIKGSDAGTSIKTMMLRLMAPTKDVAKTMKDLGINVRDASGHIKPMRDLISTFTAGMSKLGPAQRDAAMQQIFGTDAIRAGLIVLTGGVKAYDELKASVTKSGQASAIAKAQTDGYKGSLDQFKSATEGAAIAFGSMLLPALTMGIHVITEVVSAISNLPAPVRGTMLALLGMAAVMGPLAIVAVNVIRSLVMMRIAIIALNAASAVGVSGAGALAGALGILSKVPVAMLGLGAAAAAVAIMGLLTRTNQSKSVAELYSSSLRQQAAAHREAAAAVREQKAAMDDLAGVVLDAKEAQLGMKESTARLRDLQKQGKQGTDEYAQALINSERAAIRVRDANRRQTESQQKVIESSSKSVVATQKEIDIARKAMVEAQGRASIALTLVKSERERVAILNTVTAAENNYKKTLSNAVVAHKGAGKAATEASNSIKRGADKSSAASKSAQKALADVKQQNIDAAAKVAEFISIQTAADGARASVAGVSSAIQALNGSVANVTVNTRQTVSGPAGPAGPGGVKGTKEAGEDPVFKQMRSLREQLSKVLASIKKEPISKEQKASALQDKIEKILQAARDVIDAQRSSLGSKMSGLAGYMTKAFEDQTEVGMRGIQNRFKTDFDRIDNELKNAISKVDSELRNSLSSIDAQQSALTPAEAILKSMEDSQASQRLADAISEAQTSLRDAYKTRDPKQITAARKALDSALYDQQLAAIRATASLEREAANSAADRARTEAENHAANLRSNLEGQAEIERAGLEARQEQEIRHYEASREIQRQALESQLAALETQFAKGKTSTKAAQDAIVALLNKYGIDYRESGNRLGEAFAAGLIDQISKVQGAAKAVALAVAKYLKLRSPADKGPLSTLDTWWSPMGDTLMKGMDPGAVMAGAYVGASGMSMGGGVRPATVVHIHVEGNTFLGSDRETAEKLGRILRPVLDQQVGLTIGR
jgi:TP901 family phage tail tape measure protein